MRCGAVGLLVKARGARRRGVVRLGFTTKPNLPDEDDNHLLELALAGAADTIVTHNLRDLQQGELRFPSLTIQSPRQFLSTLP
jgi:predicted nucleic acid-binding protein